MQQFQFDNLATGSSLSLSALEKDGKPWFVAADVCNALGIKNSRQALASLEENSKGVCINDTLGGRQQVNIINEAGLYALIFRSRKASAKEFQKWVFEQVIPSIRQNGGYINGQEALTQEEQTQTLQVIQDEAQRLRARHVEDRDARSEALKFMSRTPSYGPGGNPRRKKKGVGR